MQQQTVSPWMTFEEARAYGNFKEKTLRHYVFTERLPFFKRGKLVMFTREDIDAFMAACRREPKESR
jgi:hypothetical protein